VHLLVSEQYTESIMHGATIKDIEIYYEDVFHGS